METTTDGVPTPANTNRTDDRFNQFSCPKCGGDTYSPTYRTRKCVSCGHSGDATAFFDGPTAHCPDCGDVNVRFGVDDVGRAVFTCKRCITGYREV
jgi:predicted RNA-binding Zn-ribbon protein involved in translation (DUF1610 family)